MRAVRLALGLLAGGLLAMAGSSNKSAPGDEPRIQLVPQTTDERIEDIQESADGTRLLTHDRGFAPRLWDARTLRLLKVLGGQTDAIRSVGFSNDGRRILCVSEADAQVWDAKTGRRELRFVAPEGLSLSVGTFDAAARRIALGSTQGEMLVVPVVEPARMRRFEIHKQPILDLAFAPDGAAVATASADATATTVRLREGAVTMLKGAESPVRWVSFSPDGRYVLATALDNHARLYTRDGTLRHRMPHAIGDKGFAPLTLMSALFVGDGKRVLTVDETGQFLLTQTDTGEVTTRLKVHEGRVREIRRTRRGDRVATYGDDEALKVIDLTTGKSLPFERGGTTPTAGEFSPGGDAFWVGYGDGDIRRHNLDTGKVDREAVSAAQPIYSVTSLGEGHGLWIANNRRQTVFRLDALGAPKPATASTDPPVLSPDGRRALLFTAGMNVECGYMDVATGRFLTGFRDVRGAEFTADSQFLVTWHDDGAAHVWNAQTAAHVASLGATNGTNVFGASLAPQGTRLATVGHEDGTIRAWDWMRQEVTTLGPALPDARTIAFSPDGSRVAICAPTRFALYDLTGKKLSEDTVESARRNPRIVFSNNGRTVAAFDSGHLAAYDVATGKRLLDAKRFGFLGENHRLLSPDGERVLLNEGNLVRVVRLADGQDALRLTHNDQVMDVGFTPDGGRILTVDKTDGVSIWDPATGVRLGSFLTLRDGNWLCLDREGRYDASEPGRVEGAAYVIRWSGGLETVAVPQLKDQFYEPGLLAKLLGKDREPPRAVPPLDRLRLFPAADLRSDRKDPLLVDVALSARDNGGIGRIVVRLNGKQILTRKGIGYFRVNVNDFRRNLLPETYLAAGRGNLLEVFATNEAGDLSGPPIALDLGVPADLKAPDVRLWALFVGASDYVGSAGDLQAPAADANALANAVQLVGRRLLPDRVNVTVLATGGTRPTRANILAWFDDVAKRATAGDIVLTFFAGHGVSRVGERRGYFFVTPDADPSAVTEAVAQTATVSGEDLKAALGRIAAAKQVVILDTCHSGAAASSLLQADRSLSGDYQRAWEAIKDGTGTWMLAGAAADQLSYESANVEHGMLTYALLEAIDRATAEGLRAGPSGDLFVDVERWLGYAASRVESLKSEVGLNGLQRPEFKRSRASGSFDIGVLAPEQRGALGLRPPRPILLVGEFDQNKEDPARVEEAVRTALQDSNVVKFWPDVQRHPNVYRVTGTYERSGDTLRVKVFLQRLDGAGSRRTIQTFELEAPTATALAQALRKEVEGRVKQLEQPS